MKNKTKKRSKYKVGRTGLVNMRELSNVFKLSIPTIRKLIKEPGFPVEKGGSPGVPYKFNAAKAIRWKAANDKRIEGERMARAKALDQAIIDMSVGGRGNRCRR